jgi:hypothetical protein
VLTNKQLQHTTEVHRRQTSYFDCSHALPGFGKLMVSFVYALADEQQSH